jgi:hypothetical protein
MCTGPSLVVVAVSDKGWQLVCVMSLPFPDCAQNDEPRAALRDRQNLQISAWCPHLDVVAIGDMRQKACQNRGKTLKWTCLLHVSSRYGFSPPNMAGFFFWGPRPLAAYVCHPDDAVSSQFVCDAPPHSFDGWMPASARNAVRCSTGPKELKGHIIVRCDGWHRQRGIKCSTVMSYR